MKRRESPISKASSPFKGWTNRFAFGAFIALSFSLMLLGKADTVAVERLRSTVADLSAPVLSLIAEPISTVRDTISQIDSYRSLQQENARLIAQNRQLMEWQGVARHLTSENEKLRTLLNVAPRPFMNSMTARIIADNRGAFARTLLVDAGYQQGVEKNQAAVTEAGLVGRVVEVGRRSARLLLITDINSRIPVMRQSGGDRAVLSGTNGDRLKLLYLDPSKPLLIGERIVTSGNGGIFPPGIPIGRVAKIEGEQIAVEPFVDWGHLEYLKLISYRPDDSLLPLGFAASMQAIVNGPDDGTRGFEKASAGGAVLSHP
ncbi:rod shape-determining protein MreC [Limibacillus sp. MBR-115]|uniref:rod shape-determining protein MreC n=1 Tax=Limibacillus sp. MBR-115 TaxID=3156465 RepID=UPI0033981477